jgi:branched-chain amino acid transport system substrate-binding protein
LNIRLRRANALLGAVAVTALGLAGCSRTTDDAGSGGAEDKVVKIGVIAPLTGSLSSFGLGIKNSVDLAVNQANAAGKLKGWKIVLAAEDDTGKAEPGAAAANKLASDATVAGVIGTVNSSVAQQVAPVLQRAKIAEISPANSNPSLTRGADDAKPARVWDNYYRVCAIDSLQGPFLADYAYKTAGLKTVVSVNDTKTYGKGLAEAFEKQFEADGGRVLSRETVSENERDFGALVTKITGLKPDLVFYGGEHPASAPLSAQLGQGGFTGPIMGGDGMQSGEYATGGGRTGDMASNFGAPTEKLPDAKAFIDAYKAANYKEGYDSYGALSYDAANILVGALVKVLPSASDVAGVRGQILQALQATKDYKGVTGTTTFDQFGDTSNKVLTVYKVEDKAWKDAYTNTYQPS